MIWNPGTRTRWPSTRRRSPPGCPAGLSAAVVVYMTMGLIVLVLWLFKGTASTDLIGAFALSLLGWLIGAAGVVFQTERPLAVAGPR